MPFPFDEYPWAKFEDLNIAYMIHRLGLIISQAQAKLDVLDAWKTATEQDLENWKNNTMDLIAEWEQDTEQDLAQWKIDTIAALDVWKAWFITQYEALRVETEHIRDVASAAAQEATQAAASASADAAAISASAAQIQANTDGISHLESAIISALANDAERIQGTAENHADLNTYMTPGTYRVLYTADAAFVDNAPVTNTTYRLIVMETSANDVFVQIALINTRNNNSRVAVRSKMTSGWSEWTFMCDSAYTDAALTSARSTLFSLLESDATDITGTSSNRTDLNNYRTPGNYKATSTTYVDNGPVPSVSFRLAVLQTTALNRVYQIMFCNSGGSAARIWIRHDPGTGNWSEWVAIADRAWTQQQLTGKLGLTHSDAAAIPDGSDLNNLTAGTYYVENATHAATMINGPVKNGGYILITTELISAVTYAQLAIINTNSGILYYRVKYSGTWTPWSKALTTNDPEVITSATAAQYFPNNSFNDVTDNAIYYLSSTLTLTDGPDGDNRIISPDGDTGSISGTLFVYSPQKGIGPKSTGVVQLLVGYRSGTYFPTLSYRIGSYSGSAYTWSKWSKFEQNGYLHASNQIIYGGSMIYSDLNDIPANSIYQLDLNLDGSDAAHTLAHHPAPGVSCVVMCYAYSYSTEHGKVQVLYTIDGRMYWRYGYFQTTNDYRWTQWFFLPKLPASLPSVNGTYTLKCTVASGSATLSWVAD